MIEFISAQKGGEVNWQLYSAESIPPLFSHLFVDNYSRKPMYNDLKFLKINVEYSGLECKLDVRVVHLRKTLGKKSTILTPADKRLLFAVDDKCLIFSPAHHLSQYTVQHDRAPVTGLEASAAVAGQGGFGQTDSILP